MTIQTQPCCCDCRYFPYGPGPGLVPTCVGVGVSSLAGARLCFAGPRESLCSLTYSYDPAFQAALLPWIRAGGRFFFSADNYTCFGAINFSNYNNLLGFLGSGMQLTTNFPDGCPYVLDCVDASSAAIGIMNGLVHPIMYKLGGEISGGTPLAYTSTLFPGLGCNVPHVLMAAERIGNGLIVACASSWLGDGFSCDISGNCQFWRRMCLWSIDRIMGP